MTTKTKITPVQLERSWAVWTLEVPDDLTELVGAYEGPSDTALITFRNHLAEALAVKGKGIVLLMKEYSSKGILSFMADTSTPKGDVEKIVNLCRLVAIAKMRPGSPAVDPIPLPGEDPPAPTGEPSPPPA
jgi:hypothetical protein